MADVPTEVLEQAAKGTGLTSTLCARLFEMGWAYVEAVDCLPVMVSPEKTVKLRKYYVERLGGTLHG